MTPTFEEKIKLQKRALRFLVFFCLFGVSIFVLPHAIIRQTETVMITSKSVARTCRSDREFPGIRRHRSSGPTAGSPWLEYCGIVRSDHGSFILPETTWLPWFGPNREELYDLLTVGCRYLVVVSGPGTALHPGEWVSTQNRVLQSAIPVGECEIPDPA